jgi:CheY-like chemotaxis protein
VRKEGWPTLEAENGREALARIAERTPGLILLDLMMPEMDGFQFLDELRRTVYWPGVPVVVVTAKDLTMEDRLRLDGLVGRVLQKKSCGTDELLGQVRDLVVKQARRPA